MSINTTQYILLPVRRDGQINQGSGTNINGGGGGGGGGISSASISGLTDVSLGTLNNYDTLGYNSSTSKWLNISAVNASLYFYTKPQIDASFCLLVNFSNVNNTADNTKSVAYATTSGTCTTATNANYATSAGSVTGGITGAQDGTYNNYITKYTDHAVIGHSQLVDDGTNVGVGKTPSYKLDINGTCKATSFNENGTSLASKYLGISSQASDSAALNGQSASYYQPVSSAINSGNINSQSVNYATTAGTCSTANYANSAGSVSGGITGGQSGSYNNYLIKYTGNTTVSYSRISDDGYTITIPGYATTGSLSGYAVLNSSPTFTGTVTATDHLLSSDERLKTNIKSLRFKHIPIKYKSFELKSELGQKRIGVIAQELQKTNPEFIREGSDGMLSVSYIDLLIAKVSELEYRIKELENKSNY